MLVLPQAVLTLTNSIAPTDLLARVRLPRPPDRRSLLKDDRGPVSSRGSRSTGPVSSFDYNGNGRIDFTDVVWLFNRL